MKQNKTESSHDNTFVANKEILKTLLNNPNVRIHCNNTAEKIALWHLFNSLGYVRPNTPVDSLDNFLYYNNFTGTIQTYADKIHTFKTWRAYPDIETKDRIIFSDVFDTSDIKTKDRHMLISSDGYSIDTDIHPDLESAQKAMREEYYSAMPDILFDDFKDMSYISDYDAILYNNGKDVRVWSIVRIPPEDEK